MTKNHKLILETICNSKQLTSFRFLCISFKIPESEIKNILTDLLQDNKIEIADLTTNKITGDFYRGK